MGTAPFPITATQAVQVLQTSPHGPAVLTNNGPGIVYLDDQSTVSPYAADHTLLPGDKIQWQANSPCWAICGNLGDATLDVSFNVQQFATGSLGSGAQAATVAYAGPLDGIVGQENAINVRGFQTVRLITAGIYITDLINPVEMYMQWRDDAGLDMGFAPGMVLNPSATDQLGFSLCADVIAPNVFINYTNTFALDPSVQLIGYATRQPQLAYETANPEWATPNQQIFANSTSNVVENGILVANDGIRHLLPVYSGHTAIGISLVFNVAPATPGRIIVEDTWNGRKLASFVPTVSGWSSSEYTTDILLGPYFRPRRFYFAKGSGYATVNLNAYVTTYANSDTP